MPDAQAELCEEIRQLIFTLVPNVEEKFSFKLPFYHYFGMLMYLQAKAEGIHVTFLRGKDLALSYPELETKERAIAASIVIPDRKSFHHSALREMIIAAAEWNEEARRLKIPMVKRKKR